MYCGASVKRGLSPIILMTISEEWLNKLNREFRENGIEPQLRPLEALRRYGEEHNITTSIFSPVSKEIYSWFEAQSKPHAHEVGGLFETVYFFDSTFWPVEIPIIYGQVMLNYADCIKDIPTGVKADLCSLPKTAWDYLLYWADCVDYSYGKDDLCKYSGLDEYGMQFLLAADQELRSSISQLKERRPSSRSILSSRLATEMFLKSFIALKVGLTEQEAKALGHNLEKSFDRLIEITGYYQLHPMKTMLSVYPPIHERYNEQTVPLDLLWKGHTIAQSFGALVTREHTDRDMLSRVLPPEYLRKLQAK